MKKALTLVVLIVTARMAFAQGQVQFNNSQSTGPVRQWTGASNSNPVPVRNGRVEILTYYNSTTASLTPLFIQGVNGWVQTPYTTLEAYLAANPGWVDSATAPIISLQAGVFFAPVLTLGTGSGVAGAPVSYAIAGWTGSYATWDLAYAANVASWPTPQSFMGISLVFTIASANPLTTPPGVPLSIYDTFTGLTLAPVVVPEPTTVLLAGLGAAALMLLRRRRYSARLTIGRSVHRLRLFCLPRCARP